VSLLWYAVVGLLGLGLGPLVVVLVAPYSPAIAKQIVRIGIRSGGDWIIKPVGGTRYGLEVVEYDDAEGRAWRVGGDDDEDREYYDDHGGRMRTLFGKSFGLALDDVSAIVDPVDAKLGQLEGEKATDGGQISSQSEFTLEELRERALVGTAEQTIADGIRRRVEFVNPFVALDDERDSQTIVDVRDAVTLLSKNASPETPRKTAENAAAAERAFDDWGELKRNASLIAAFLMGAIVTEFIAGGGSGGAPSVSLSIAQPVMETALLALGVTG
jgi:hypothetical protein